VDEVLCFLRSHNKKLQVIFVNYNLHDILVDETPFFFVVQWHIFFMAHYFVKTDGTSCFQFHLLQTKAILFGNSWSRKNLENV